MLIKSKSTIPYTKDSVAQIHYNLISKWLYDAECLFHQENMVYHLDNYGGKNDEEYLRIIELT